MKLILLFLLVTSTFSRSNSSEEDCTRSYVQFANKKLTELFYQSEISSHKFQKFVNPENKEESDKIASRLAQESCKVRKNLLKFQWENFTDPDLKQQIQKLSQIGEAVLPTKKYEEFVSIVSWMVAVYGTIKFPDFNDPSKLLTLTEANEIFASAKNPAELREFWLEYKNIIGKDILKVFPNYVQLKNEAAHMLGLVNGQDIWSHVFKEPDLPSLTKRLMEEIAPLYKQVMSFVRFRLREIYGPLISEKSPIPAHLVGDLNMQDFEWLTQLSVPYEGRPLMKLDLFQTFKVTRLEKYKLAEEFLTSVGLQPLPQSVWETAVFEMGTDKERICHPTAFDIGTNFLIIDCQTPKYLTSFYDPLIIISFLYTWMYSRNLPFCYRTQKELEPLAYSISTLGGLSMNSVKYLSKLENINFTLTSEDYLNNMFYEVLKDLPTFPRDFALYSWRRNVFSGKIAEGKYNCEWWKLAVEHQGIEPPSVRSNKYLDCATNMKMLANASILVNFLGKVFGYQLFREFCIKTGQYDPESGTKNLVECCLHGEKIVGNFLSNWLKMGAMKKWTSILEHLIGKDEMSADGLLEYFDPLMKLLEEENKKNGEFVGWEISKEVCVDSIEDDDSQEAVDQ